MLKLKEKLDNNMRIYKLLLLSTKTKNKDKILYL